MTLEEKWETWFVVAVALLFWIFLVPAFRQARLENRDQMRQENIASLRAAVEKFGNETNLYPAPSAGDPVCTSAHEKESWLFGSTSPLLTKGYMDMFPKDVRRRGRTYTYCATDIEDQMARGYYFETILEGDRVAEEPSFDFKVDVRSDGTVYRACGGITTRCD